MHSICYILWPVSKTRHRHVKFQLTERQFELEFWSLAVWLDHEEELVQLVQEEFTELPVLSKAVKEDDPSELSELLNKLFQVIVICHGCIRNE
jgi:hypothetical protein